MIILLTLLFLCCALRVHVRCRRLVNTLLHYITKGAGQVISRPSVQSDHPGLTFHRKAGFGGRKASIDDPPKKLTVATEKLAGMTESLALVTKK